MNHPAVDLKARSTRAVRAAVNAARALGLTVGEPVVLHDVFSVVVHLAPLRLVARVPMVIPPDLRGPALPERQQRELDVVTWLAERGVPVVAPSDLVPRAPAHHDGFWITFWELAELAEDHVPYGSVGSATVVALHEALVTYPTDTIPFMSPVNMTVPTLLESLTQTPELISARHLDRARLEWEILNPVLGSRAGFEQRFPGFPVQAIHGDSPSHNVIRTVSGDRFADFEDVTLGPIEWDLAMGSPDDIADYTREASTRGVRAPDPEMLQVMNSARMLQLVACLALVPELPLLEQGIAASMAAWDSMPLAGGLG